MKTKFKLMITCKLLVYVTLAMHRLKNLFSQQNSDKITPPNVFFIENYF